MSLNGLGALHEIDQYISKHEDHNGKLSNTEKHDLDIVRRDAIHSILQHHDAWLFSEFDRLKLVELEYLYQVRGLRQVMPSAIFREGYEGYGNSWTGSKIRLLYPQDRKRGGRESREPFLPINKVLETRDLSQQLVPLRIDLSTEKYRLRDRILWNADDTTIPLELFVENTLEDYGLPLSLTQDVSKSLRDQISNHLPHIYPHSSDHSSTVPSSTDDSSNQEKFDEDLRITIKLDITIGQHQLVDQFEWDINNPDNDPEMFGLVLASEFSLPMEYSTAISHAIREQCQAYSRALFSSGYQFDGKLPHDPQLQNELAMPVGETSFLRHPELLPLYSPSLNEAKITGLNPDEQETEKREMRSRRRQGRSSRRNHGHHHDSRPGSSLTGVGDLSNSTHDPRGPEFCTPIYNSSLPGGLDRNLSILHMTACQNDDNYGGDKQDLVYYFHKHRRENNVQSAAQFDENMIKLDKPRWIVKMKVPAKH